MTDKEALAELCEQMAESGKTCRAYLDTMTDEELGEVGRAARKKFKAALSTYEQLKKEQG